MAKPTKTQRCLELGERINAHLKRFEADSAINYPRRFDRERGWVKAADGVTPYYEAGARGARHRVWVRYIAYQGGYHLSCEDAERYLAWLDAGNEGRHFEAGITGRASVP